MPPRVIASINRFTQIGPESVTAHGTAVDADTRLASLSFEITPNIEVQEHRATGQLWTAVTVTGKDSTDLSISGGACYEELPYLFCSLLKDVQPTQPSGTATYDWEFQSDASGGALYRSYTVEQGDRHRAGRVTHVVVTEAGLSMDRSAINVSGAAIGQRYEDDVQAYRNESQGIVPSGTMSAGSFTFGLVHPLTGGTFTSGSIPYNAGTASLLTQLEAGSWSNGQPVVPGDFYVSGGSLPSGTLTVEMRQNLRQLNFATATIGGGSLTGGSVTAVGVTDGTVPTAIALNPLVPNTVNVYMDSTAGSIGTTKLTGAMMTGFTVSGRYSPFWNLDSDEDSFATVIESEPSAEFTLTAVANSQGRALLEQMRGNRTAYFRIEALGGTIELTNRRRFRFDCAGQVVGGPAPGDQDSAYADSWTIRPIEDASLGYAFKVSIRNSLAAL
jgi:hypothetical protein